MKFKIILLSFLLSSGFLRAQWTPLTTGTTGSIGFISFPTKDTGYATDGTQILKTTNGGGSWSPVFAHSNIYDLLFISQDTGFIYQDSLIRRSFDGGVSWTTIKTFPSTFSPINLSFPSHSIGYESIGNANGDSILCYKTINTGSNWNLVGKFASSGSNGSSMYFSDINSGYIGTFEGIYQTTNGGGTWIKRCTDGNITSLSFPTPLIGYAVGNPVVNNAYKSTDGGVTWNVSNNGISSADLYSVSFVSASVGYACGGNGISSGYIYKTIDGGSNWTLDHSSTQTYFDICFPVTTVGYSSAGGGEIVKMGASTGILEQTTSSHFQVYPNPAKDFITVLSSSTEVGKRKLSLNNSLGQELYHIETTFNTQTIDLTSQPKGLYFVRVTNSKGESAVQKLVIE
jgi:photosystem II stability/assembly factor-like uncharacterized protein